ncbi:MAG: apolipoprotein N-acyltransferase [Candidatus Marinimicrobia bacterium]|nr:apolipoprotein N-acyltransferase [Candidatus Neomarinimicrobiota bacterium]
MTKYLKIISKFILTHRLITILISVIFIVLSFAPFNQFYFVFIALIPLIHILNNTKSGFKIGYSFGFIYSTFMIHWLAFNVGTNFIFATISMILGALYLAVNYGVIGYLFTVIKKRNANLALWSFPLFWVSIEFIRSYGVFGFPWISLGNSQVGNLPFLQIVDIGGIYLVSFIIILTNILLYKAILSIKNSNIKFKKYILSVALLLAIPYIYGIIILNINFKIAEKITFRIVQPNYGSLDKWKIKNRKKVFKNLDSLSTKSGLDSVDVIVWPESATPVHIRTSKYRKVIEKLVNNTSKILITGSPDHYYINKEIEFNNSLFSFVKNKGIVSEYDKVHLVPFGEYIPFSTKFEFLKKLNLGQSNFSPGENNEPFTIFNGNVMISPMICYESIFPQISINNVRQGAKYHINVTNDSWFGNSLGPYQHAAQSVVRAVESKRAFVRCANTGISMVITPKGIVKKEIPLNKKGFFDAKLSTFSYTPLYIIWGNTFAIICVVFSIFILGFILLDQKMQSPSKK